MDGAVTREEAAARWRLDLEDAEASSQQTWPGEITAGMSEFERLTLITEILMPVRNELALEFEETQQRDQPSQQPAGDSRGDDDRTIDQEEETGELGANRVYSVVLATAAACNRWLKEDLGPGLRASGQGFETPMTLDPATDIDHWARERAGPMMEEPVGDDVEDGCTGPTSERLGPCRRRPRPGRNGARPWATAWPWSGRPSTG